MRCATTLMILAFAAPTHRLVCAWSRIEKTYAERSASPVTPGRAAPNSRRVGWTFAGIAPGRCPMPRLRRGVSRGTTIRDGWNPGSTCGGCEFFGTPRSYAPPGARSRYGGHPGRPDVEQPDLLGQHDARRALRLDRR